LRKCFPLGVPLVERTHPLTSVPGRFFRPSHVRFYVSQLGTTLMLDVLNRSIDEPIRTGLTWDQSWRGPDSGLIRCWERGRELSKLQPALSERGKRGELVLLPWKGGVESKLADEKKGSLQYLAMWQGLRGEDLVVPLSQGTHRVCSRTGQVVVFSQDHFLPVSSEK